MNLTANSISLTVPESQKLSWDWSALSQETPIERATGGFGRKRHIEGFANESSDTSAKRVKLESTPTDGPSNRSRLSARSTMRSPKVSSASSSDRPSLNRNQSNAGIVRPNPPAAPKVKSQGPFYIDSDSEEEDTSHEPSSTIPARQEEAPRQNRPLSRFETGTSSDWKEAQRLESHRKREEAKRRNDVSFTSPSTFGRNEDFKPSRFVYDHDELAGYSKHSSMIGHPRIKNSPSNGSPGESPTSLPFKTSIKQEVKQEGRDSAAITRRTPATQPFTASAVIDLTDDDPNEVHKPPGKPLSKTPQAKHGLDFQSRENERVEQLAAPAKEQAEKKRLEYERRMAEEERQKRSAEDRRKDHERNLLQAAEFARLQHEKKIAEERRMADERKRREAAESARLQHEKNEKLREQQRPQAELQRQSEHAERLRDHNKHLPNPQTERKLPLSWQEEDHAAERRRQERELAERREMEERDLAFNKARDEAQRKQAEERRQVEESRRAEQRRQAEQRKQAEQRAMELRMQAHNKARAKFDREQAEKEKIAEAQRLYEENQRRLEREAHKAWAAKPLTDRQREEQRAREERIQKQRERNAQNRQHADDDIRLNEPNVSNAFQPQSTSGLAQRDGPVTHSHRSGTVGTSHTNETQVPAENTLRRIGFSGIREITRDDTQLLKWRAMFDFTWDVVVKNYHTFCHQRKTKDALRKRHAGLVELLDAAGIDSRTIKELYEGDPKILDRVNRLVDDFRASPLYDETKSRRKNEKKQQQQQQPNERQQTALPPPAAAQKKGPLASILAKTKPRPSNVFSNITDVRKTATQGPADLSVIKPSAKVAPEPLHHRPTTGGKALDYTFFFKTLEHQAKVWQEMYEPEKREEEAIDQDDYLYYIYVVLRREWDLDDLERCKHNSEQEPEWMECPGAYEELNQANTAASKEVMRVIPGRTVFADGDSEFSLKKRNVPGGDGEQLLELKNPLVGTVETMVVRRMRTFEDRILPKSKLTWRPKIVYQIKQRITKEINDEVLDTTQEDVEERPVNDTIYYDLEQANEAAATHFVKLTYHSEISHQNVRSYEMKQTVDSILEHVGVGQTVILTTQDDFKMKETTAVNVWVAELSAVGPRN
ncbi:hypothetical protein M409DRAFT_26750 [Zasmidium cellare ATCC 36951]|uniref:Uncharacterized protein n=1 Tax=Zasmidium cellare ATCC 36951 TaxID=1080233 RepID=A0A6A6C9I2_ZASCE|nr:uncharacterized protein M409DRAFT_26750 [Zasmidium cellare ATCC 36951]KAF2162898.1 hypothetical protein M409DRAFT_26750 [Zasmidium cellare ATCC 36951]